MNFQKLLGGGVLTAALLTSTASFADVTPGEVWDNWRDYLEAYGYSVTASENMSGSSLTVSNISMRVALPEDGGVVQIALGELGFTDQGDGTVMISLPSTLPINVHIEPTDGEIVDLQVDYSNTGLAMVVSGSVDEMTYTYTASQLTASLVSLIVDGKTIDGFNIALNLSNLVGSSVNTTGTLRTISQNLLASALSYDINIDEPEGTGNLTVTGETVDLRMVTNVAMPDNIDMQDIGAALKSGMAVDGTYSSGAGNTSFSFVDGSDTASGTSATTGTSLNFAMDANHLAYGLGATGLEYHVIGSEIPFPINVAAEEILASIDIPIAKSAMASDFSFLTKIVGLAPDGMIWGMVDPSNALPHDPATIIVDVAGTMNWLFDILDPAQAEMAADMDIPAEIHGLTLKELTVSAAGALLTGAGSFTFNNADLETFDGMPAPDGSIDLKVVGANGLIDGLISMGVMSDDDAMGARMMLGLFGRPGDGEDTVLSTIEVKSNGQIFANGQRIQ